MTLRLTFMLFTALLLWAEPALAQTTGRAATGERRVTDTSKDRDALNALKTTIESELSTVGNTSQDIITRYGSVDTSGYLYQLELQMVQLRTAIENLRNRVREETDTGLQDQADSRDVLGGGVPSCDAQTEDLVYDATARRWTCVTTAGGCMTSQNVWRIQ